MSGQSNGSRPEAGRRSPHTSTLPAVRSSAPTQRSRYRLVVRTRGSERVWGSAYRTFRQAQACVSEAVRAHADDSVVALIVEAAETPAELPQTRLAVTDAQLDCDAHCRWTHCKVWGRDVVARILSQHRALVPEREPDSDEPSVPTDAIQASEAVNTAGIATVANPSLDVSSAAPLQISAALTISVDARSQRHVEKSHAVPAGQPAAARPARAHFKPTRIAIITTITLSISLLVCWMAYHRPAFIMALAGGSRERRELPIERERFRSSPQLFGGLGQELPASPRRGGIFADWFE